MAVSLRDWLAPGASAQSDMRVIQPAETNRCYCTKVSTDLVTMAQ
jgi:hypothetical protein